MSVFFDDDDSGYRIGHYSNVGYSEWAPKQDDILAEDWINI